MADLFMFSAMRPRDALTMFRLFLLTMYKISHFRLSSNIFKTMSRLSWSVSASRLGCLGALGDEVAAAAAGLADFWMPGTFSPRTYKQKSGYFKERLAFLNLTQFEPHLVSSFADFFALLTDC